MLQNEIVSIISRVKEERRKDCQNVVLFAQLTYYVIPYLG